MRDSQWSSLGNSGLGCFPADLARANVLMELIFPAGLLSEPPDDRAYGAPKQAETEEYKASTRV